MIVIIFIAILALFLTLSRRKLAVFNFAILASVLLNQLWNVEFVEILTRTNLKIPTSTISGICGLVIILTPAFLILAKSNKQEKWILGIISSIFTAILTFVVVSNDLSKIFVLDDISKIIIEPLIFNRKIIILFSVILSVLSILSFRLKKDDKNS